MKEINKMSCSDLKIEQNKSAVSRKDLAFMELYEEQDNLIQEGITLISNKIVECLELLFSAECDHFKSRACCKMSREWQVKHHGWEG